MAAKKQTAEKKTKSAAGTVSYVAYVSSYTRDLSDKFGIRVYDVDLRNGRMAEKEKVQTKNTHDPYSLPPVSFLQSLMNGREVPLAEKKILENLSTQMHFSNEVINVLIAYVLKISNNRLSARFVSSVAAQWARDGIETKEQALLEAKKNLHSSRSYQKVELPAYMNKPLPESKPASEQLVQKVKAMQQEMKKHDA